MAASEFGAGGRTVYLDYAASAPMRPEAREAERAYDESGFAGANPNSLHHMGRHAAVELERAREEVARAIGGGFRPMDVVFTSGGTEANNLAVLGLAEGAHQRDWRRSRVVMSAIEHESVLRCAPALRERGFEVVELPAGADGRVSLEAAEKEVDGRCALVSVMYANNETGAVQPVAELGRLAHAAGAMMHTDAVQAFCHVPLELSEVDAVSVTAHKLGGPVGVGALAVRGGAPLRPQSFGGGQERGRRNGTQPVRAALAFAAAATAASRALPETGPVVAARAERLRERLEGAGVGISWTLPAGTPRERVLPGTVSIIVGGCDSQDLVIGLDERGFEVSAGSACSASSAQPSHVLLAMGLSRSRASSALRVSFDERVADDALDAFAKALVGIAGA